MSPARRTAGRGPRYGWAPARTTPIPSNAHTPLQSKTPNTDTKDQALDVGPAAQIGRAPRVSNVRAAYRFANGTESEQSAAAGRRASRRCDRAGRTLEPGHRPGRLSLRCHSGPDACNAWPLSLKD
jgi:hypothetical protein